MVGAAGFFQYSSVSQMRADMKASVDAELERDKREIAGLTVQGKDAITEAKTKTTQELDNVRTEVRKKIDTEFRSDNIANLVANAAKERTEKELTDIIRSEASTQVAKGIKEQGLVIQQAIEEQTKEAVRLLDPTIRESIDKAVQDATKTIDDLVRMEKLITLARSDDREAFDYLVQVAAGNKPESANPDLLKLANATAGAIIRERKSAIQLGMQFKEKQTSDAMKQFMVSAIVGEREAALDQYPQDDKTILPILIKIIEFDRSLSVLYKAVQRFNTLTKQSFEFWETKELLDWWDKNWASFE